MSKPENRMSQSPISLIVSRTHPRPSRCSSQYSALNDPVSVPTMRASAREISSNLLLSRMLPSSLCSTLWQIPITRSTSS